MKELVKRYFVWYGFYAVLLLDEKYLVIVHNLIVLAKDRILLSQFKIDSGGISGGGVVAGLLRDLVRKRAEGVTVEVLLDCIVPLRGRAANNAAVALWLQKENIDVRYMARNRCAHAKVLIVDGLHVVIGSHNWTRNSLTRNFECSVYLRDLGVVERMEQSFRRNFDDATVFGIKQAVAKGGK